MSRDVGEHVRAAIADQVPDTDKWHAAPEKPVTSDTAKGTANPSCKVTLGDERIWDVVSHHGLRLQGTECRGLGEEIRRDLVARGNALVFPRYAKVEAR